MTERDRIERRLLRAGLPDPPDDLRGRVLAGAQPIVRAATRATWADRVWFSGRWRFAAVAVLVALVALDRVSTVSVPSRRAQYGTVALETATTADAVARQAGLSPTEADAMAREALLAASRPAAQDLSALGLRP